MENPGVETETETPRKLLGVFLFTINLGLIEGGGT